MSDSYGDTHHTATPSIWFQQTTSLNILIAIAKHLTNARNRLTNNNKEVDIDKQKRETDKQQQKIYNDIYGTPYRFTKVKFHNFQRLTCS